MKKKLLSLLTTGVLLLAALTGCGSADTNATTEGTTGTTQGNTQVQETATNADPAGEQEVLKIGVTGDSGSYCAYLANLAIKGGYLEDALADIGYTYELVPFKGAGPEINEALASGSIDAAIYGDFPAFVSKSNGVDTTVVALANTKQQFGVISANSDIQSAKDLEGKKLIVPQGTVAQYFWESYAKQFDVDTSKVETINAMDALSLLQTGEADAYIITIPTLKYLESLGLGTILPDSLSYTDGSTSYVFEVTSSLLAKSPELGTAINVALIQAFEEAQNDPQKLYDSLASDSITADMYKAELSFDETLSYLSPEITDAQFTYYDELQDWLISHSIIAEKVDTAKFFDAGYYQKAVQKLQEK